MGKGEGNKEKPETTEQINKDSVIRVAPTSSGESKIWKKKKSQKDQNLSNAEIILTTKKR